MASGIYDVFKHDLMVGDVDLDATDNLYCALMTTNHTAQTTPADLQSDATWADVSANEIPGGSGYTSNGKLMTTPTVTTATGTSTFDADDVSWTSATLTTYHTVLYNASNADSLMCTIDFGGAQSVTGGTFTIEWNPAGIISLA